jgi:hypothetical protein
MQGAHKRAGVYREEAKFLRDKAADCREYVRHGQKSAASDDGLIARLCLSGSTIPEPRQTRDCVLCAVEHPDRFRIRRRCWRQNPLGQVVKRLAVPRFHQAQICLRFLESMLGRFSRP